MGRSYTSPDTARRNITVYHMNIFEFSQEIIKNCALADFIKELETILFDDPVVKI